MTAPHALVIGGGIAGTATAMALRKAGVDATIHDAGRDAAWEGAFLTLAANGIDALRVLGLDGAVLDAGFPTPSITLRSTTGRALGETSAGGTLADGTTSHTLLRADLHRVLLEEARARDIPVHHGRRLVAAHPDGRRVRAVFADGSEADGDLLVGCDGVHSAVRTVIDPAAPAPAYGGLLNTGGIARGVAATAPPGTYEMVFGRRAFFGHVPAPDGAVWWFANVPERPEPSRAALRAIGPDAWRARLLDLLAQDAGPAQALIRATPELLAPTPVHAIAHLPRWHAGRMVLAGDAAHAPTPSSGQGASLAIEDAVVLALALRDLGDPAAAFARYEAERRPRVERIVAWAARMNSSKAAGPVGRRVRDALMPVMLRAAAGSKAQRSVHEHHLEWTPGPAPALVR